MEILNVSENEGLLNKAQAILAEITPKFSVWAKRLGYKRAGIMSPLSTSEGNFYYITDSFGIEAMEMAKFHESEEFWNETISKTSEWQCFSSDFNEIEKFRPFFRESVFERINKIFFLPFGERERPYIFITVEFMDDDDLTLEEASKTAIQLKNIKEFQNQSSKILAKFEKNIDSGLKISNSRLFILSLRSWIEDAIKSVDFESNEVKNAAIESIASSACTKMNPLFRSPNCIANGKNGEVKIVLFAQDDPDEQLLAHHISKTLIPFLGNPSSSVVKPTFLPAGICQNKKGTVAFLSQE